MTTRTAVRAWLGIRYATAERFEAPVVRHGWDRDAPHDAYGAAPYQDEDPNQPLGAEPAEDCHFLNVWAPEAAEGSSLPVYVSVYGGGFEHGSASNWAMDGSVLAATGRVVVVSLNYRVGALGFVTLAGATDAFPEASNLGLRDVIAALAWIRENIADFGGDPARVTVGGESAGGFLVTALAAAPSADGLYARLAVHSAGASRILPLPHAAAMANAYLQSLDATEDPTTLRDRPVADLVAAQSRIVGTDIGARNGPAPAALGVVDDHALLAGVLVGHPFDAVASGRVRGVPLLVTATQDEIAPFRAIAGDAFVPASLAQTVEELVSFGAPPGRAEEIVAGHADDLGDDAGPAAVRERVLTDYIYRLAAARLARAHARAGGSAHLLLVGGADGEPAGHACDVPALLGRHWPGATPAAEERDRRITEAVLAFVTETPLGWPSVTSAGEIAAGGTGELRAAPGATFAEVLRRWEGIPRP
ncbi:carboxylesterase family protein [Microbacterium betulae]|uniref:Carboxylic ester hydrolase n=1 Tax=Microbacterium betulae TaxID=2981139 RepID=A0AA97FFQ7_9MICO|nr:carboxylesterase family protein [Microbacterium sp. AB]WOF22701.1 carboxylesterase family protein [Microbacterium sp. AB]